MLRGGRAVQRDRGNSFLSPTGPEPLFEKYYEKLLIFCFKAGGYSIYFLVGAIKSLYCHKNYTFSNILTCRADVFSS